MVDLAGLLVFLTVMTGTPGPANMLLFAAASRYGVRTAASFLVGVVLGMQFVVWPAGLGLLEFADHNPVGYTVLKWTCAGYITWLAWKIALSRVGNPEGEPSDVPGFVGGLLVHPLNPKAWIIAAGAFTQFVAPDADPLTSTTEVALVTLAVGVVLQGLWFLGGQRLAQAIGGHPGERYLMASLGGLTIASVGWAIF